MEETSSWDPNRENRMCCIRFGVMSSITMDCFTLLWPHWPFGSSGIPTSFLTRGLCNGHSYCLECTSFPPTPGSLSGWLFTVLAPLICHYLGIFSDHSYSNCPIPFLTASPPFHFVFFSLEHCCNVLVHVDWMWEHRNTGAQRKWGML